MKIGDVLAAVFPPWGPYPEMAYTFEVMEVTDNFLIVSPRPKAARMNQSVWEEPWRRFSCTVRGFRLGDGLSARTMPWKHLKGGA